KFSAMAIIYLPAPVLLVSGPGSNAIISTVRDRRYSTTMRRYPEIDGPAVLLLFCLAPHGVFPAARITSCPVSSYLAFSPLPGLCCQRTGGVFSVTLSVTAILQLRRPRVLRGMLPYGVRTFLQRTYGSPAIACHHCYFSAPQYKNNYCGIIGSAASSQGRRHVHQKNCNHDQRDKQLGDTAGKGSNECAPPRPPTLHHSLPAYDLARNCTDPRADKQSAQSEKQSE